MDQSENITNIYIEYTKNNITYSQMLLQMQSCLKNTSTQRRRTDRSKVSAGSSINQQIPPSIFKPSPSGIKIPNTNEAQYIMQSVKDPS
jgi:hypothetical protein